MKTTERGGESRDRILDGAEELFRKRGYNAVSLLDVAKTVRMRKPSLYHHFPGGKEELFTAVHERMFARIGDALDRLLIGVSGDIGDGDNLLEKGLFAAAGWFLRQPPMFLLSMLHNDMPDLSDDARQRLIASSYGVIMGPLVEHVQRAAERGDAKGINPYIIAGGFLSLLEGTMIASGVGFGHDVSEMVHTSVDMLVYGAAVPGRKGTAGSSASPGSSGFPAEDGTEG